MWVQLEAAKRLIIKEIQAAMLAVRLQQSGAAGGAGAARRPSIHGCQPAPDAAAQRCADIVSCQRRGHIKALHERVNHDVCQAGLRTQQVWAAVTLQRGVQPAQVLLKAGALRRRLPAANAPAARSAACAGAAGLAR